jgi:hypothetical protein
MPFVCFQALAEWSYAVYVYVLRVPRLSIITVIMSNSNSDMH